MFYCPMCEREVCVLSKVCVDCRKIKNFMNCYSRERVLEIVENVLARTEDKQDNKIKEEVKKEIEAKQSQYDLRNKDKKKTQVY